MGRALILALAAALPAYWDALPTLHSAGDAAVAADPRLEGSSEAWGDPATGTYGLVHTVRSTGPVRDGAKEIANVHQGVRAELAAQGAELSQFDVAPSGPVSTSVARYTVDAMLGETRSMVAIEPDGRLRVTSASCFYGERDPERARRQCQRFLSEWSRPS